MPHTQKSKVSQKIKKKKLFTNSFKISRTKKKKSKLNNSNNNSNSTTTSASETDT